MNRNLAKNIYTVIFKKKFIQNFGFSLSKVF
jgi:hypothetical protein